MQKLKVTCKSKEVIPIESLTEYQGNLAEMSKQNYEKLKKAFLKYGICFALTVWKNKGKNLIIDGTGRFRTLTKMKEEGFEIPALPVVETECKDEAEAKRKILLGRSEFHKTTEEGLYEFLNTSNISIDEIKEETDFSGIVFEKMEANFGKGKFGKIGNTDLSIIIKILVVEIKSWMESRNKIIKFLNEEKINYELDE
jgi:hypothetical protein